MYKKVREKENQIEGTNWEDQYQHLIQYCRFITKNKWDSEEIAQESIVRALEHYGPVSVSSSLLKKIAYNNWIDTIRRRKREEVLTLVVSPQQENQSVPSAMHLSEMLKQHFTPKQAVIFLLKEVFSYRFKEIAQLMDTTETAVKASFIRAKKRLERDEKEDFSSFWREEEMLLEFVTLAIQNEEPTVLIQALPSIESLRKHHNPTCAMVFSSSSHHTLSLAAA
ncbi:sigma factor-like helix-turn-helix DNA-binding protein [Radiobacillus deserti]|uniref:RNA polymerase subunit sigma n=1 Tax=Radiobacillus deserti TaxID=2594883 RepID=A0A516KI39_9BACI|nr:sigma factor-like helix-turn-helix DNA-binding protein [Radiobacillus deserti]QDP41060.1 RNA polymerase subunit sigma [Radiobacillus deserti]